MEALEQDLGHSQKNINQWLALYNKASEDIISFNFNTQIHNILDAIACFDHQKVKALETQTKDEVVISHLSQIALKIKNTSEQKPAPASVIPPEPVKRQPRIVQKTQPKNTSNKVEKQGFISSMFNRLKSKEKKSTEMIFPKDEPKCYWDEKRRSYVFEGEEPEAPKQIPKPPPKGQKVKVEEPKGPEEQSELDSLTAPPTFKRKGVAGSSKAKSKIKQEVLVVPSLSEQPMSFANLLNKINSEYSSLLQKVRKGCYERHISEVHVENQLELSEFIGCSSRLLNYSEDIHQHEQRFMLKWAKSSLAEPNLKILENLTKKVSQSADIYQILNGKLNQLTKEAGIVRKSQEILRSQPSSQEYLSQIKSTAELERLNKQLQIAKAEMNNLRVNLSTKEHLFSLTEARLKQKTLDSKHLFEETIDLRKQVEQLGQEIYLKSMEINERNRQADSNQSKEQQLERNVESLRVQNIEYEKTVESLKKEVQGLKNQKMELDILFKISQANKTNESSKFNEQSQKQKLKIQTQLQFYEERQKNYLANIKSMQEHSSFIYEFEDTLQNENNLLNSILEKRLQLGKNTENQQGVNILKLQEENASPHSVVLELSDIINSITQTHLDRLQVFNKNYTHLNKKYQEAKELVKKIKSSSSNENVSLSRSVTRLKGLIETYKTAKEESQQKYKILELECEKLKKKLEHYKQEDKFNKTYLTKLKSSSRVINQNDSVISLQEDNQELAQTIQDLQKEVGCKEQNYTKLQKDLEDLLNHYEKNQARLANIEKKARQNDKEVRVLRQEREELLNKINLLQVKLTNQREKNEELSRHHTTKLNSIENTNEKKMKLLKEDLERAIKNQEDMRNELQQERINISKKMSQLNESVKDKQSQNNELLALIQATNEKVEQQSVTIVQLQQRNDQLERKQFDIANSIHDYNRAEIQTLKQSQKAHNEMIKSMLVQYKAFEEDEESLREDYQNKIDYLVRQLEGANCKSEELLNNIEEYVILVNTLDSKLKEMQNQTGFAKTEQQRVIQKLEIQNTQLNELVICMQEQIETKKLQIVELETLTEKISIENQGLKEQVDSLTVTNADLCNKNEELDKKNESLERRKEDLEDRLSNTEKQMEVKQSEITNKSQSLLIKSEELEEKNEMILNTEENLVLNREELQDLQNALQQKDNTIAELTGDLEALANEVENLTAKESSQKELQDLLEKEIKELKDTVRKNNEMSQMSKKIQNQPRESHNLKILSETVQEKEEEITRLVKQLNLSNDINKELQNEIKILKESMTKSESAKDKQEVEKEEETESEMEYLLKQIEDRQTQITELKEHIKSLQRQMQVQKEEVSKAAVHQTTDEQKKEEQVEGQMQFLLKEIKEREEEASTLKDHVLVLEKEVEKQKEMRQSAEASYKTFRIQNQKLEIDLLSALSTKKTLQISVDLLKRQNNELQKLSDHLAKEIQHSRSEMSGLSSEETQQLIVKLQSDLKEKSKIITITQIEKQETERLLFIAQNQMKESESKIEVFENQIKDLQQIIESQEQALRQKNSQTNKVDDNLLREELKLKDHQLSESNRKIQELLNTLTRKSTDYEEKIESLERDIVSFNSLRSSNKKLEDSVKTLQLQNVNLLNEKVELMRSNENLMKINEKLITEVSPHYKLNFKHPPKAEKTDNKEDKKEGQKNVESIRIPSTEEGNKEMKEEKKEQKGFFGAISSLFLTPTQNERLVKK